MSVVDIDREERRSASYEPLPAGPWDPPDPREYADLEPKCGVRR